MRPSIMSLGLTPSRARFGDRRPPSPPAPRASGPRSIRPLVVENRAVAVVGGRAQADVHPEVQRVAEAVLDGRDDARGVIEAEIVRPLGGGHGEQQEVAHAGVEIARDASSAAASPSRALSPRPGIGSAPVRPSDDEERLNQLRRPRTSSPPPGRAGAATAAAGAATRAPRLLADRHVRISFMPLIVVEPDARARPLAERPPQHLPGPAGSAAVPAGRATRASARSPGETACRSSRRSACAPARSSGSGSSTTYVASRVRIDARGVLMRQPVPVHLAARRADRCRAVRCRQARRRSRSPRCPAPPACARSCCRPPRRSDRAARPTPSGSASARATQKPPLSRRRRDVERVARRPVPLVGARPDLRHGRARRRQADARSDQLVSVSPDTARPRIDTTRPYSRGRTVAPSAS